MIRAGSKIFFLPLIVLTLAFCPSVRAQEKAAADSETLRKAAQNPIASLISVPMQNNANFGIGPFDRTQNVLNVQPVIPVRLSAGWNFIMRIIQPIITQPNVT